MRWRELVEPARMERVAVVAPARHARDVLAALADAGVAELQLISGRTAGEAELDEVLSGTVHRGRIAALAGWSPASTLGALATRLAALGGSVVRLPLPPGVDPPTQLLTRGASAAFQPLVDTYGTVPYADLNPSLFAGLAYVAMFGMMFGDVGHGALLFVAGLVLFTGRPRALARYRAAAPFVCGAGVASALFGAAYGEAFGPTRIVPTLWLAPLDAPVTLMAFAVAIGAALLAISYALGSINRWREGGFAVALVALSGFAGVALYAGLALVGLGLFLHRSGASVAGGVMVALALVASFVGLYAAAGGRFAGAVEAGVELFDGVIRLGTNTISFARLAAFGLTHAALGGIVWTATTALWGRGTLWWLLAALVFLIGNAVTFGIEALVAAVQALRLEYYELFSRIFIAPGRAFAPWHLPAAARKEHS